MWNISIKIYHQMTWFLSKPKSQLSLIPSGRSGTKKGGSRGRSSYARDSVLETRRRKLWMALSLLVKADAKNERPASSAPKFWAARIWRSEKWNGGNKGWWRQGPLFMPISLCPGCKYCRFSVTFAPNDSFDLCLKISQTSTHPTPKVILSVYAINYHVHPSYKSV
jgi:hypothetical protein